MSSSFYDKIGDYYELLCSKDYSKEVDFLDKLFKQFNIKSVLDLGCGLGSHDLFLAKKGYSVIGIDNSVKMIYLARNKCKNFPANFIVGDMRNFKFKFKFDAVICMIANFQYFINEKDINSLLFSIKNSLTNDGIFLVDVYNPKIHFSLPNHVIVKRKLGNDFFLKIAERSEPDSNNIVSIKKKYLKNNEIIGVQDFKVKFYNKLVLKSKLESSLKRKVHIFYDYTFKKRNGLKMQFLCYPKTGNETLGLKLL
ncbi:MAG: class I SAM-dependent DNA methyltransferase [Candidatus Odinarchaeia archaeon]